MKPWPDPHDTERPVSKTEIVIAGALTIIPILLSLCALIEPLLRG